MLTWCKETKRIYYFVLCPAFLIAFAISLFRKNDVLTIVSVILYVSFLALLIALVYKIMLDVNRSFKNELDIRKFLDFYESVVKDKSDKNSKLMAKANLVTGYLACGELGKAFDVYNRTPYSQTLSKKAELLTAYLLGYTECLLTGGYLNNIENNFSELDELLEKVNPKNLHNFKISVDLLKFQYIYQSGNYDKIEELYADLSGRIYSVYQKIKLNYWCGVYYNKIGKIQEALGKFEFVAENGKETIFAKKAKDFLKLYKSDDHIIEP